MVCHLPFNPVVLITCFKPVLISSGLIIKPASSTNSKVFKTPNRFFNWYEPVRSRSIFKVVFVFLFKMVVFKRSFIILWSIILNCLSANSIGDFNSLATALKSGPLSLWYWLTTTGTLDFIIPAFSAAIFSNVSPNKFIWSKLMFVIKDTFGLITFVESNLPPKPTSIIATSSSSFAK